MEPILVEWESFARTIWPQGVPADPVELRDEAEDFLRAAALDMQSDQSTAEQAQKSMGRREGEGGGLTRASSSHGTGRAESGFDLAAVIAEYRALRASVLRLWRASGPSPDLRDLDDLTRFNEAIDESLAHAVRAFAEVVERERQAILASERASRRDAEAANRAKDLFLATLSHEMRTPLNAVVGWLGVLRHEGTSPRLLHEGLDVIERNTAAQVQLIDDLLDVARIIAGKLHVDLRPCDLADVLEGGLSAMRPAAEARGIALDVQLDRSASTAHFDRARIQQVVWNLVSNAIKFTPKGGRVEVSLSREGSNLRIQVRDTGLGISPELLPRVFDRFQQAERGTRRRFAGLGLGLSIVKHIVEAHGGTTEAASPGEGGGSTFTVRLPVRAMRIREEGDGGETEVEPAGEAAVPIKVPPRLPPVRLDGVHVLVVDDEADVRRVLMMVLERAGAVVVTVGDVPAALDALAKTQPHVLVSDLGMPERDGFDLIRQLRAEGRDAKELPAVALTAFVQKDDADLALSAGFQVHLPKPIDPYALTAVIARLSGRAG